MIVGVVGSLFSVGVIVDVVGSLFSMSVLLSVLLVQCLVTSKFIHYCK